MAEKPKVFETRTVSATFELRSVDSERVRIEGYAATFGQPYDLGAFREVIDPTAFNRTLGTNPDVRLLIDHEGQPLARTKSGTLTLSPDSTGLHMATELEPSDPDVQRLVPKMRRKDLDQMSFAFRVPTGGDSWSPDYALRTLRNVDLHGGDVSVVTYPANENTSVALRARDQRTAIWAKIDAMLAAAREARAGAEFSAKNMAELRRLLDLVAQADDSIDAAQAGLADLLGVPNPDNDEADQQATQSMQMNSAGPLSPAENPELEPVATNSRPLDLAVRIAASLSI